MKKVLLKVGQAMNIDFDGKDAVKLYASPRSETLGGWLTNRHVKVLAISSNRQGCGGATWWIQVEQVNNPAAATGWMRFNVGEVNSQITEVAVFPKPANVSGVSCA